MQSFPVLVAAGCSLAGLTSMLIPGITLNSAFGFGASFSLMLGGAAVGTADLLSRSRVERSFECNGLFLKDAEGRQPMHGDDELSQADLHFRDNILLYEYFHRDAGRSLGASHQTGWIGCVALLLSPENSPWWQFSAGLPSAKLRPAP